MLYSKGYANYYDIFNKLYQDLAEARQETEKQREIMNIISRMINDSKQKELRK